ncbi:hypothetical protein ACFVFS_39535 [Kitasatospora sp. NPDC057692]|uniref:hypothetical protein n=1 Tax=Kitasatospora sp. NPDC057692 TaxID=3346215 RepID=UPI0036AE472B
MDDGNHAAPGVYWDPLPTARRLLAEDRCLDQFGGLWRERNWRNVPGPFYGADTVDEYLRGCLFWLAERRPSRAGEARPDLGQPRRTSVPPAVAAGPATGDRCSPATSWRPPNR